MAEKIILYVGQLNKDKSFGGTDDPKTIAFNNKILDEQTTEEFVNLLMQENEASHISAAGRYICVTNVSVESKTYMMVFIDLKQNEKKALEVCSKFGELQKQTFMKIFYYMRDNDYHKFHDNVRLI